jgi:adenosylcobinamide-phosphate synthase
MIGFGYTAPLALAAAVIDVCVGYPDPLRRAAGHPLTWLERWRGGLARRFERLSLSPGGTLFWIAYLAPVLAVSGLLTHFTPAGPAGFVGLAFVASGLSARQALDRNTRKVADELARAGGRLGPEVAAQALRGLGATYATRVLAPLLWIAVAGLPAGAVYLALHAGARERVDEPRPARVAALAESPGRAAATLMIALGAMPGSVSSGARALSAGLARGGGPGSATVAALRLNSLTASAADLRRGLALFRRASAADIAAFAVIALAAQAL